MKNNATTPPGYEGNVDRGFDSIGLENSADRIIHLFASLAATATKIDDAPAGALCSKRLTEAKALRATAAVARVALELGEHAYCSAAHAAVAANFAFNAGTIDPSTAKKNNDALVITTAAERFRLLALPGFRTAYSAPMRTIERMAEDQVTRAYELVLSQTRRYSERLQSKDIDKDDVFIEAADQGRSSSAAHEVFYGICEQTVSAEFAERVTNAEGMKAKFGDAYNSPFIPQSAELERAFALRRAGLAEARQKARAKLATLGGSAVSP
jgi:hypothetical protein